MTRTKGSTTTGPWILKAGRSIETPSGEFYLTYGHDKYGNPNFKDFCELDANARLIAAAPALYAALKAMLEEWHSHSRNFTREEPTHLKLAREALAQADGKEQP